MPQLTDDANVRPNPPREISYESVEPSSHWIAKGPKRPQGTGNAGRNLVLGWSVLALAPLSGAVCLFSNDEYRELKAILVTIIAACVVSPIALVLFRLSLKGLRAGTTTNPMPGIAWRAGTRRPLLVRHSADLG